MENLKVWLSSMRLRTLPLSVSGVILGSFFAKYNGFFQWDICLLAILTTLSFQILSNLANDYGDGVKGTDNNNRVGPERAIQSGKIAPKQMLNAIKMNTLISIGLAFSLVLTAFGVEYLILTIVFFALGIACVVAAIRYTVGDNAYGYRALGDVFVFIFFGLVSVIGSYVLYAKKIDVIVFLPAITIGLLSTAVLNLNNMRDIISDKKSNKRTLVVKLGSDNAKIYHYMLIIISILSASAFGILNYNKPINLLFIIAYVPLLIHLKTVYKNTKSQLLDPELKKLALSTVILAILMGISHLL